MVPVAETGLVTRAVLALGPRALDDRSLARDVCQACCADLDIDGAAISVLTATEARTTLWASDPTAHMLEELQFTLNEGSCIQAASTGSPVFVPDLHHDAQTRHWPVFAAAVAEQTPVRALFTLPMQWGAANVGVLDLYRNSPGDLDDAQRADAMAATRIAAMLLLARYTEPPGTATAVPDDAEVMSLLDNRAEVHQATGMVLTQLGVTPQEALARMRAHAFLHQRLLIDVARDIVARRLRLTDN